MVLLLGWFWVVWLGFFSYSAELCSFVAWTVDFLGCWFGFVKGEMWRILHFLDSSSSRKQWQMLNQLNFSVGVIGFPYLAIWTIFSYLAAAWQFLQNKEHGKAGDTAAVWPRDRWCSYFRSYLGRPQKKIRRQLLLFLEKTVPYDLCGDLRLEAHFP